MKRVITTMFLMVFVFALVTQLVSCSLTKGGPSSNKPISSPADNSGQSDSSEEADTENGSKGGTFAEEIASYGKPVMVDFGMESCVPCKMMVPILDDLDKNYQQDVKIIFVHVAKEQEKTKEFGIQMIPTQVFFDQNGKELERHTGFFSKEDILATFKKYGITITK